VSDKEVGRVDRYFRKVGVAALELTGDLSIGDRIRFSGATTDFEMDVESIQIDLNPVESAGAGDDVGIKVPERVRPNDSVFRLDSGAAGVSPEMIRYVVIVGALSIAAYVLLV
jgi:putative protease